MKSKIFQRTIAGCMLLSASWIALSLPVARLPVCIAITVMTAIVLWRPQLVFVFVAAGLPAYDLTPWTGACYFNEFDAWILAAIGAALWASQLSHKRRIGRIETGLLFCLTLSYLASALVGYLGDNSWRGQDANVYFRPLNALRIAKPCLYALPLWLLLSRANWPWKRMLGFFAAGTVIGLAITVASVAAERVLFSRLLDWTSDFRVTGPFADMHTGGAYLDAYLVMAIPLLLCVSQRVDWWGKLLLGLLLVGSLYAVFATLSRAPVIAVAVQAILLMFLWPNASDNQVITFRWRRALIALVMVIGVIGAVSTPSLRDRFATVVPDWRIRVDHWNQSLSMLREDWQTRVFGVGCGGFPKLWRDHETGAPTGDYCFRAEAGESFLHIAAGEPIYFGQYVSTKPHTQYTLVVRGRQSADVGDLELLLCEKSLLSSFQSVNCSLKFDDVSGDRWTTVVRSIDSGKLGDPDTGKQFAGLRRPVALSFFGSSQSTFDLASVELLDAEGNNLVSNSDFNAGHKRWWWTSDNHLAWHAKNLFVHLRIEQGWLGVFVFSALAVYSLVVSLAQSCRDQDAAPLACSLVGFLTIATIDSLVDSPRISFMYFILVGIILSAEWAGDSSGDAHPTSQFAILK